MRSIRTEFSIPENSSRPAPADARFRRTLRIQGTSTANYGVLRVEITYGVRKIVLMLQEATILLVEDDANDIFLMERAFNKARLANPLKVVRDGEQAISYLLGEGVYADRAESPLPSVILLDLKMPKLSGFEVLEWLQLQPNLRQIPVVVLTSSNEIPDIERAHSLGAKSYLVKPGQLQDLVEMMLRLHGYWLLLNEKTDKMAVVVED